MLKSAFLVLIFLSSICLINSKTLVYTSNHPDWTNQNHWTNSENKLEHQLPSLYDLAVINFGHFVQLESSQPQHVMEFLASSDSTLIIKTPLIVSKSFSITSAVIRLHSTLTCDELKHEYANCSFWLFDNSKLLVNKPLLLDPLFRLLVSSTTTSASISSNITNNGTIELYQGSRLTVQHYKQTNTGKLILYFYGQAQASRIDASSIELGGSILFGNPELTFKNFCFPLFVGTILNFTAILLSPVGHIYTGPNYIVLCL